MILDVPKETTILVSPEYLSDLQEQIKDKDEQIKQLTLKYPDGVRITLDSYEEIASVDVLQEELVKILESKGFVDTNTGLIRVTRYHSAIQELRDKLYTKEAKLQGTINNLYIEKRNLEGEFSDFKREHYSKVEELDTAVRNYRATNTLLLAVLGILVFLNIIVFIL